MSFRRDPDHLDRLTASESDIRLARALEALAQDRPTPEELLRVRNRLQVALSQQTNARARAAMLQPAAGLLVLVAALSSVLPSLSRVPLSPVPRANEPVATRADAPPPSALANENILRAGAPRSELDAHANAVATHAAKPMQHAVRVERHGAVKHAAASELQAKPLDTPAAQRTPADQGVALAPHGREPVSEQSTPAPKPARIDQDEVTLIQRARQQALDDPRAALRLLDQHKRSFPHGMLTQEREVLAIQLLRALSRDAEADKRAQAFRRDFPRSIYLPRLNTAGRRE